MTDEQDRKLEENGPDASDVPEPTPGPPELSIFDAIIGEDKEVGTERSSPEHVDEPAAEKAAEVIDEEWVDGSLDDAPSSDPDQPAHSKGIALRIPNDETPAPPGIALAQVPRPQRSKDDGTDADAAPTGVRRVPVITLGKRVDSTPPKRDEDDVLGFADVEEVVRASSTQEQSSPAVSEPSTSEEDDDEDDIPSVDSDVEIDSQPPVPVRQVPPVVSVPAAKANDGLPDNAPKTGQRLAISPTASAPPPPLAALTPGSGTKLPASPSASAPPPPLAALTPGSGTKLPASPSASAPPPPVALSQSDSHPIIPAAPQVPTIGSADVPAEASGKTSQEDESFWDEETAVKTPGPQPSSKAAVASPSPPAAAVHAPQGVVIHDEPEDPEDEHVLAPPPPPPPPAIAAELADRAGVAFVSHPDDESLQQAAKAAEEIIQQLPAKEPERSKAPPPAPPARVQTPKRPAPKKPPLRKEKRKRPGWERVFSDDFVRALRKLPDNRLLREVNFIEERLGVRRGGVILDLGCGMGQHAVEMAARGFNVVGYDLSITMLANASDLAQEKNAKLNLLQGDMREMGFEDMFDGVYCWDTTFGLFDEDKNANIIQRVHRSLRKGGTFLLDIINRDFVCSQLPSLLWFEGDGCVCIDDAQFDAIASRLRVKRTLMLDDGASKEVDYSVRVYSLHEIGRVLHQNGFQVLEVSGNVASPGAFFGAAAQRILVLARKR